jgi:hypothetical protein
MTSEQIAELDEESLALFPLDSFLKQYNTSKFEVTQALVFLLWI